MALRPGSPREGADMNERDEGPAPAAPREGKDSKRLPSLAETVGRPPDPWSGPPGPIGFTLVRTVPPPKAREKH